MPQGSRRVVTDMQDDCKRIVYAPRRERDRFWGAESAIETARAPLAKQTSIALARQKSRFPGCFFGIYTGMAVCHKSAVRLAIPLLILCLASSSKGDDLKKPDADQEHRIAKILHPDRTLAYNAGDHTPGETGKSFGGVSHSTKSKGFNFFQKFHPSGYASEKGFKGMKSDWKGDAKFTTKNARTDGKHEILNADKKAATKTAPTKELWDADKKAPAHDSQYAKREFLGPQSKKIHENTPISKAESWKGDMQPMTIDQVRDLLNKPKL
jgi:hypothetical protein